MPLRKTFGLGKLKCYMCSPPKIFKTAEEFQKHQSKHRRYKPKKK